MRILNIRFCNLNSLVGEWQIDLTDPAYLTEGLFAMGTVLPAVLVVCLLLMGVLLAVWRQFKLRVLGISEDWEDDEPLDAPKVWNFAIEVRPYCQILGNLVDRFFGFSKFQTLSEARSRLYQRRFLQPNTHFAAFFEIYKKIIFSRANFANFCKNCKICKIMQNFQKSAKFCKNLQIFMQNFTEICRF